MRPFHLEDEWASPEKERALVAAVSVRPELYEEFSEFIREDIFTDPEAAKVWEELAEVIEAGEVPEGIPTWEPTDNPAAIVQELIGLRKKRILAGTLERFAQGLHGNRTSVDLLSMLEDEITKAQMSIRDIDPGSMIWAADLLPEVLRDAEAQRRYYQETGRAAMGLSSGISGLDALLNGFNEGAYIFAGPPGVGKTSFCLQIAKVVNEEAPAVFVTFENSPCNLTLKAIAAQAGINTLDVQRGFADINKLITAAQEWEPVAKRLVLIEGNSRLTVSQVQTQALRAMNKFKSERCLLIVDYLQLWAKASLEFRTMGTVRERVEALGADLRGLATRLHSPVLAISSQNRERGGYGQGKGNAGLDSLKESGDLEYLADVVIFLTPAADEGTYSNAKPIKLIVAKNRHGETGMVRLIFRPDLGTLREESKDETTLSIIRARAQLLS